MTEGEFTDVMPGILTPCDNREFFRPLELEDHFAEAGVMGVLNTCLLLTGDVGDVTKEGEAFGKRIGDLPT
jgi:hypothetical protein